MKTISSIKYILVTVLAAKVCFGQAQTNNSATPTDYFKIQQHIADRNIFNPDRRPNVPYTTRVTTNRVQQIPNSFALVGTMNYGEGDTAGIYAFFDGSKTQFRKAAVLNDSIAVFKIIAINKDSVTLLQSSNKVVLQVGDQMRDDTRGNWRAGGQAMGFNSSGSMGGRTQTFGGGFDGRDRGRINNNFNSGNNGTQFNRNQRSDQRGASNVAAEDFLQNPDDAGFGGLPDGVPVFFPDFALPLDAPPEE